MPHESHCERQLREARGLQECKPAPFVPLPQFLVLGDDRQLDASRAPPPGFGQNMLHQCPAITPPSGLGQDRQSFEVTNVGLRLFDRDTAAGDSLGGKQNVIPFPFLEIRPDPFRRATRRMSRATLRRQAKTRRDIAERPADQCSQDVGISDCCSPNLAIHGRGISQRGVAATRRSNHGCTRMDTDK